MKKLICLLLVVIMICPSLYGCDFSYVDDWISNIFTTQNEPEIEWEEKIYWQGDINDNFLPGEVIVLLDKSISELNKVHTKEFFAGVEIEEIRDLTRRSDSSSQDVGDDFHQILHLILVEKTKEAVVNAIKIIELIPGVKAAEPNSLLTITNTTPNDP